MGEPAVIGVDLGATKTVAALVLEGGEYRHVVSRPTPSSGGATAVLASTQAVIAEVRRHAGAHGSPAPAAVGVGSCGVIAADGSVARATDHIPGWAGTPLGAELEAGDGLATVVLNDVHAHAVGEARLGAGRDHHAMLLVAVGSGLGGALISDGTLLHGAHGAAGHFGHMPCGEAAGLVCPCGRDGHLEALVSGAGLLNHYRRTGAEARDARTVLDRGRDGERRAADTILTAARALGRALGGLINALDPDVVVVTGGIARADVAGWWSEMEIHARAELLDPDGCAICPAQTGEMSAVLGSALHAREIAIAGAR